MGTLYMTDAEKPPRCRHRRYWLFTASDGSVAGRLLWCYECGAIRGDDGRWIRPVGIGGENPAMKETTP